MKSPDPGDPQAFLVCGLLSSDSELLKKIDAPLVERFGPLAMLSEVVPFEWTDYYNAEMGEGILRRWVVFENLVNLKNPWQHKIASGEIEDSYRVGGKRGVNIDPGFIRLNGLWLLTTKYAGHRAYLDKGIWIELTLRFLRDGCEELPWTYPDHRDAAAQAFFCKARDLLKRKMARV